MSKHKSTDIEQQKNSEIKKVLVNLEETWEMYQEELSLVEQLNLLSAYQLLEELYVPPKEDLH